MNASTARCVRERDDRILVELAHAGDFRGDPEATAYSSLSVMNVDEPTYRGATKRYGRTILPVFPLSLVARSGS